MTLPSPSNPNEWQNAFTKDQARRASLVRSLLFVVPLGFLFLAGVLFAYSRVILIQTSIPSNLAYTLLALGVSLIAILIFVLVIRAAFNVSGRFLEEFYRPPEGLEHFRVILYRLIGRPWLAPPLNMLLEFKSVNVKDGQVLNQGEWPDWMAFNLGGPIQLNLFDGTALYIERGNCFSRVVGPGKGIPFLELHETIKYVVDYRPTIKTGEICVWTKDGINIKVTVRLECQIGAPRIAEKENIPKSGALVYRYDPEAVKKAVEWNAVLRPSSELPPTDVDWIENTWSQVTEILPKYIGGYTLDELLHAELNKVPILSPTAAEALLAAAKAKTQAFGVYITSLQISQVSYPPEVEEQRRRFWEAERQGTSTIFDGQAKASSIRSREKARADAQKDLILAIADGLEKNKSQNFVEPLLLSLSRILDESLQNPHMRANLAKETLDTLERLQKLLEKPSGT